MNKEQQTDQSDGSPAEAWQQVGNQLESLGKSLASAFRATWANEENRQHVRELQSGLESMVNHFHVAVKETAASPGAQKVQNEVENALQQAHIAIRQAGKELQRKLDEISRPPAGTDDPGSK